MSIRKLISKVQDVNTGNRYEVVAYLPRKLHSKYAFSVENITFYCNKCNFPGHQHAQIDSRVYGQKRKLGSIRSSDATVTTSYIYDYKGNNIKLFEDWSNIIMNPINKRLGYYNDYVGELHIILLNNLNEKLTTSILTEAYPIKMNDLPLGYDNAEILPLEIEWQYRERIVRHQSDPGAGGAIFN